eukprot:3095356-Pleurochrysis_carterae.AAC.2
MALLPRCGLTWPPARCSRAHASRTGHPASADWALFRRRSRTDKSTAARATSCAISRTRCSRSRRRRHLPSLCHSAGAPARAAVAAKLYLIAPAAA